VKIDHYISELLFDHDCVIVTDLGGFITNYKPATINPALHVISPPSKKLAFNAFLKNNDGLLANHIAQRTYLNYADACDVIRDYVKEASSGMKNGQKLKIDKVGVLYLDEEERLQFLPDHHANYLIESFGMAPVHAPVIKRVITETKEVELPVIRNISSADTKQKKEVRIFGWKVLEMIPAAAVLAILMMTPPVLDEFNSNLSTMLPFSRMNEYLETIKGTHPAKQQVVIPQINPFEIPPHSVTHSLPVTITPTPSAEATTVEPNPSTTETAAAPIPAASPVTAAISAPAAIPAVPESTAVATLNLDQRTYFVIGGCFRSEENANKFVAEMKGKGMEATVIGQNNAGLYMVSLFSSSNYNQTTDKLPEIKTNVVESAWVYKK